ncbi:hypothetical protein ID866_8883 [Astraeus odoratus]|nr:hypothetical protein ID866_8883 [Astraeus odoratus]
MVQPALLASSGIVTRLAARFSHPLEEFLSGPWEKGIMTAVLELGALFGALLAGVLADRYSRRHSIFLASGMHEWLPFHAAVVFCVGSSLQAGAQSLGDLILGRAVGGLGVGALRWVSELSTCISFVYLVLTLYEHQSMLSPLYMAEISPPELRGSLIALEQLAIVFGVVVGFWTGFFTRNLVGSASWRIPLALQLLPGVSLCLGSFLLPPSPRFLVLKGRLGDAMRSLAKLRLRTAEEAESDPLLRLELLEMEVTVALEAQSSAAKGQDKNESWMATWKHLFHREYVDRTLIGVMIMFFQQWSGINALLYYGPTLVTSIGLKSDFVTLLVSGGIGIVQFFAVIPAILYLDRWGKCRKPLLRGCWHGVVLCDAMDGLYTNDQIQLYEDNWAAHTSAAWLAVVATFLLFAIACFAAHIWSVHVVPETAGVSLEDMDAVFGSLAGKRDGKAKEEGQGTDGGFLTSWKGNMVCTNLLGVSLADLIR